MQGVVLTPTDFDSIKVHFKNSAFQALSLDEFCKRTWAEAKDIIANHPTSEDQVRLTITWVHYYIPSTATAAVEQLEKYVPSVAIAMSLSLDSFLNTGYGGGNEGACSAYGELTARAVSFVLLCVISYISANWIVVGKVDPNTSCKDILFNVVLFVSIPVWLLTTNENYIICFTSNGGQLGKGKLKLVRIIVGIVLIFWAGFLGMCSIGMERAVRRGAFNCLKYLNE